MADEQAKERFSVLLRTGDYRGDHAADVVLAFEAESDETVGALMRRVLNHAGEPYVRGPVVEIRPIIGGGCE